MRLSDKSEWTLADTINALVVLLLILSPWLFRYSDASTATWSAVLTGTLLGMVVVARAIRSQNWQERAILGLGIWIAVTPWALGFGEVQNAAGMHVTAGVIVAAMAALDLWVHYLDSPSETT